MLLTEKSFNMSAARSVRGNKHRKSGVPRNIKEMSKEQLEVAIRKKRECNAKALEIVEKMLEVWVEEKWFLNNLKFIGENHFQDIIEERAISKICGYPLCAKELGNIPHQQYRISIKLNKVYDITERKNFCSNQCYKAVKFIRNQLLTSPLWLRDKEDDPVFKLLPINSIGTGVGDEIDFGQNNIGMSEDSKIKNKFLSVEEYTKDSLVHLSKRVDKFEEKVNQSCRTTNMNTNDKEEMNSESRNECAVSDSVSGMQAACNMEKCTANLEQPVCHKNSSAGHTSVETGKIHNDSDVSLKEKALVDGFTGKSLNSNDMTCSEKEENDKKSENLNNINVNTKSPRGQSNQVTENDTLCNSVNANKKSCEDDYTSRPKMKTKDKRPADKKVKCASKPVDNPQLNSIIHIEKCLGEWFTIESMCFLLGEEKVKEMVLDKGECIKEYYKGVNTSSWDPTIQERYETICKKLNLMEIQEQQFDAETRVKKPLPDYNTLKEESVKMDIKVRAFYEGKLNYEIPSNNTSPSQEEYKPSYILPLIDIHAQNALRRRMVLDNLKRVLPDLLRTFGLLSRDISSDVRQLVSTFALAANNITFKPMEWSLLGLIIIKMLSLKDIRLKIMLESEQGSKYQTMMMISFQQDGGYLERLMVWITDVDNLMKKH